ncbi:DUF6318 family protein [Demequina sp. SO4-18]|uniref:DUF6318 family protein n=1 Tax=Demequina sp. SO4-18 TaxID=3401026 RepID=UPI003B5CC1CE
MIEAIPPLARQEDLTGAQEFAKFFLAEYQDLMREDPRLFDALAGDNCDFCETVRTHYASVAETGHTLEGGEVIATAADSQGGLREDGTWSLSLPIESRDLIEVDSNGTEVDRTEGGTGEATLILEFKNHWIVVAVGAERG